MVRHLPKARLELDYFDDVASLTLSKNIREHLQIGAASNMRPNEIRRRVQNLSRFRRNVQTFMAFDYDGGSKGGHD